jgi:hypothetical protein
MSALRHQPVPPYDCGGNDFWRRGRTGLVNLSRRPLHSPRRILGRERIDLRDERKLGPKRIQAELLYHHDNRLSTATIWKVLRAHERALGAETAARESTTV